MVCLSIRSRLTEFDIQLMDGSLRIPALRYSPQRHATVRAELTRFQRYQSAPPSSFHDTSVPLPESPCRWCDALDELLTEVSGPARGGLQLSALFAKYLNFSFLQHRDAAMAANVSISERERHDEAVAYFFLGGCRELRRHMAGCRVCSGC